MNRTSNIVSIFDNPEALRRQTTEAIDRKGWKLPGAPTPAKRQRAEPFVMFPTTFIKRLAAAHVGEAAVLVALVLCDMARRNERFPVTGAVMCKAGQSRQHKRRVLERLERVGMIAVEWRGRKSPMVTPLVRAGKR